MFSKSKRRSYASSAVVTGAGSGIGRAFALELAKRGGQVVCADIALNTAKETVSLIEKAGGSALAVSADVSDIDAVQALSASASEWLSSPVDLVINNAGVGAGGKAIGEVSIEDWQWVLGVNMWGVIHGCHVFAPQMKARGKGGIINVCSAASFAAAPGMGPYSVSKAAALALSETLAAELSSTDIAVTALCPTWVKTNIVKDGRIGDGVNTMANALIDRFGRSPTKIAKQTLDALDKRQLYVLPQIDARAIWRTKRLAPSLYTRGAGLLQKLTTKTV